MCVCVENKGYIMEEKQPEVRNYTSKHRDREKIRAACMLLIEAKG